MHEMPLRKFKKPFVKKKKKEPVVIKFDENARREFLTGFHKRKVQRKHKALEEFEKQLKMEKKRIKAETKEAFKKLLTSQKSIPELNLQSEEIDMGTHSVTVTELSAAQLARNNNWIGINEVRYEKPELEYKSDKPDDESELEGMEMTTKKKESHGRKAYLKSCKDIKKMIQKQATLNVKSSEIFKKKSKLEKIRQIKKKKKEEKKRKKLKKQKMMENK